MVKSVVILRGHSGCPLPKPALGDQHSVIEGLVLPNYIKVELVLIKLLEILIGSLSVVRVLLKCNLEVV